MREDRQLENALRIAAVNARRIASEPIRPTKCQVCGGSLVGGNICSRCAAKIAEETK